MREVVETSWQEIIACNPTDLFVDVLKKINQRNERLRCFEAKIITNKSLIKWGLDPTFIYSISSCTTALAMELRCYTVVFVLAIPTPLKRDWSRIVRGRPSIGFSFFFGVRS